MLGMNESLAKSIATCVRYYSNDVSINVRYFPTLFCNGETIGGDLIITVSEHYLIDECFLG